MLPTTLVTLISFLMELCSTSPVYNMQPAYITANIGKNFIHFINVKSTN